MELLSRKLQTLNTLISCFGEKGDVMETWILVANRAEARIFAYPSNKKSQMRFLRKIENPRGRLKAQDINADKPGVFSSVYAYGSKLESEQSPTERVAEEFAKTIATQLEHEKSHNNFEKLIVIADPTFLGLLRSKMSRDLHRHVIQEVAKDLGAVSTNEMHERLELGDFQ